MDEHVSLFVAIADVYDAASAALNEAQHLMVAIPMAEALKIHQSHEANYEDRSELLRLQAVFHTVSSSCDEFRTLTKTGKAALDEVVEFVERVFALYAALGRTPESLLRKVVNVVLPQPPSLRPLRELLFNTEENLAAQGCEDFRFAAARLRAAVASKPPLAVSAFITALPKKLQLTGATDLSFSFDTDHLSSSQKAEKEDALNLDELNQMANDSSIAKIEPKPVAQDDDEMVMLDQLDLVSERTEAPKSKEAVKALLSEWKNESSPKREEVAVAVAEAENPMPRVVEKQTPRVAEKQTPRLETQTFSRGKGFNPKASADWLKFVSAKKVTNVSWSASAKMVQVHVKKLFSTTALKSGDEKKEKKEKKSKKVDKEKAKMEKLMKESGIADLNQKEQQELVRGSAASTNAQQSNVASVDKEPLFFVRFVLADGTRRNSVFFLASEPGSKEDVLTFPAVPGQIEINLMGSSGSFGIESNVMLGLSLFDSFEQLESAKVVSLQCGRHSIELKATVVDAIPEKGNLEICSWDSKFVPSTFADRNETIEHVLGLYSQISTAPTSNITSGPVESNIKKWAEQMFDLESMCDLIVSSKYVPFQGLSWRTSSGNHLLHLACLCGHVRAVSYLIAFPGLYPLESKNNVGASCLHYAVLSGSVECVSVLLRSVNNEPKQLELLKSVWMGKKTPLHLAAMMNFCDVAEEMLQGRKGLLEARDLSGSTPMIWAAFCGSVDMIRCLQSAGGNMQAEDEDGNTPLMTAIIRSDVSTVSAILSLKSGLLSVGKKNLAGDSALWLAMESGARAGELGIEVLQLVIDSLPKALELMASDESWIDPEFQITFRLDGRYGADQNTLFHRAVLEFPDEYLVKIIPVLGHVCCNAVNRFKQSALMFALAMGKTKTAAMLFDMAEKDAEFSDEFGNSLLHYSLCGSSMDFTMKKTQTKLETRNCFGMTPTMHCFAVGSKESIRAVLGYGGDPTSLILANQRPALSLLETRDKSALLLPWKENDSRVNGCFRIPLQGGPTAVLSPSDKKQLTQGLSRRSSLTLKKGSTTSSALILALGQAKF